MKFAIFKLDNCQIKRHFQNGHGYNEAEELNRWNVTTMTRKFLIGANKLFSVRYQKVRGRFCLIDF